MPRDTVIAHSSPTPRDVIEWDVVNWSRALPFWETSVGSDLTGKSGLEIGARGGGLALWMARKGCRVVCSFYQQDNLAARALHQTFGVADLISYETIDATTMEYDEEFDIVMLKSVIGGIGAGDRADRQREAIRRIHRSLRPGGVFLFAENLTSTAIHRFFRRLKRGDSWRYLERDEFVGMLSEFSDIQITTTGFGGLLGTLEWQRRLLGHLDDILSPLLPSDWHYVIFGVAKK